MKVYQVSSGKTVKKPRSFAVPAALLIVGAILLSAAVTGFDMNKILRRGSEFFVILAKMFPPNLSYLPDVWTPLFDTIKMSFIGSLLGSVLAVPFAVISSSNIIKNRVVIAVTRLFLSLVRTLPSLVMALIATYVFGLGTLAGTTAIAIFTFAFVGKALYEQIETADMGAYEAMEAMGSGKLRAFCGAIIPQVFASYLSLCLFCFEGNVRYAAILGYVGAGGLGLILSEKVGWREYDSVGTIVVMLFLTVLIIEGVSHYLRRKLT